MKAKHIPSGYILGWIDSMGKAHTKSIPRAGLIPIDVNVRKELRLLQLDLMQQEFPTGKPLPLPIIAEGSTRKQIKQELLKIADSKKGMAIAQSIDIRERISEVKNDI